MIFQLCVYIMRHKYDLNAGNYVFVKLKDIEKNWQSSDSWEDPKQACTKEVILF